MARDIGNVQRITKIRGHKTYQEDSPVLPFANAAINAGRTKTSS